MEGVASGDSIERAASALLECSVLLIHLGAGASVDSGLAAYKDVADFPAYKRMDVDYDDLCRPEHLDQEDSVPLFYGFWGSCFNAYRKHEPHAGYRLMREWAHGKEYFMVYTSNVDSFARRSKLASEKELYEVHGVYEHWQCHKRCSEKLWRAPHDYVFDVDEETMMARPQSFDSERVKSTQKESVEGDDDEQFCNESYARESFFGSKDFPRCPSCKGYARPAILMFVDFKCVEAKRMALNYSNFCINLFDSGERCQKRVVVLEVGCGKTVPGVRQRSEDVISDLVHTHQAPSPLLIRVNPDFELADDAELSPWVVSLKMKALDALVAIQSAMEAMKQ